MSSIKFGLFLPQHDFGTARELAVTADESGFWSVSTNDHFEPQVGRSEGPQLECFTMLTAVATATERVKIVPMVACVAYRAPALLAKIGVTLDHVSGGRVVMGLGAGWNRAEYEAHGYDFPQARARIELLEETASIVKAMWSCPRPVVRGKHTFVAGASDQPRPVREAGIPIMIGGSSPAVLRVSARHADIVNLIPPTADGRDFLKTPELNQRFTLDTLVERVRLVRALANEEGRDPGSIEIGGLSILGIAESQDDPSMQRLADRFAGGGINDAMGLPGLLLGSPEQVIAEVRRRHERSGLSWVTVAPTSARSLRLFIDEVMPAFAAGDRSAVDIPLAQANVE